MLGPLHYALNRLLNYEGSLMAFAGKSDKKENVTAAIAANIWMSHERGGRIALPDETLNYIVLDCLVSLESLHYKIISLESLRCHNCFCLTGIMHGR